MSLADDQVVLAVARLRMIKSRLVAQERQAKVTAVVAALRTGFKPVPVAVVLEALVAVCLLQATAQTGSPEAVVRVKPRPSQALH